MKKGQALLVVLLILGVVTTVGLSVASRSVTEVSISTTQEESTRALEAAEAGVEKSLANVNNFGSVSVPAHATLDNGSQVVVNNTQLGMTNNYLLPYKMEAGDVATVYLSGAYSNIIVCWGNTSSVVAEIMMYTSSGGNTNMRKWLVNSGSANHNCPSLSDGGDYYWTLSDADYGSETPLMLRVRLYNFGDKAQPMAIKTTGGTLPDQGLLTTSTGTDGDVTRKIRVNQLAGDMPYMFDAALFSGTDLVK